MASGSELYRVQSSEILFDGPIIAVRRDTLSTSTGIATREIVEHFSAVAVVAVRDGDVMLIRQYRHGVGRYLWEIPAGLLDMVGELPLDAARRELAEEAGVRARRWSLLGDVVTSPGFSEEVCRIFLAEEIDDGTGDLELEDPKDEEADLERHWVPVEEAVDMVRRGEVDNSIAVAGLLHLAAGTRRAVDEPFAYRSGLATRRATGEGASEGADMKKLR